MSIVKALIGVLLVGSGGALLLSGLVRLGWQRHGASPADFAFLHLDWIAQPQLPYWSAHMVNLALAGVGAIALVAGAAILLRQILRPGRAQRHRAQ
ncbi:hypothetical protein [Bradyrhizobium sp. LTSP885]|uniref:hypothetical protein n=1 Tax=Bradyrhizobium sp. LTSP885 TaxID=1619232 RepID=UPI000A7F29F7|nr:hypothetical protein [Bradyrhizobium sp. LTSP885]